MNRITRRMVFALAATLAAGLNTNGLGSELKDTAITQIVASVLQVDREARQLLVMELEGIDKAEPASTATWLYRTFSVKKGVSAFDYIRAGDKVRLGITTSIALDLREATDEEIANAYQSHTISTKKGVLEHKLTAVCKVVAIDPKEDSITFQGPRGRLFRVKVYEKSMLKKGQIGDTIVVSYNQGQVVEMSRAD